MGHVNRVGLAVDGEREVVADVLVAGPAAAPVAPAMLGDLDEARGEDGTLGGEFSDAAVDLAPEERRMARDSHEALLSEKYISLSDNRK